MSSTFVSKIVLVGSLLGGGTGCGTVLGTSVFEECVSDCAGAEETGEGGAGGAEADDGSTGSTSSDSSSASGTSASSAVTSTGAGTPSTGSGSSCYLVTLTYQGVQGDGRVRIDVAPDGVDFDEGVSQHCLPPGEKSISIECRSEDDDDDDDPLVVGWGNALCSDGSVCSFFLDADQTFDLTGTCD